MEQELENFIMALLYAIGVFFALAIIGIFEEIIYRVKQKIENKKKIDTLEKLVF